MLNPVEQLKSEYDLLAEHLTTQEPSLLNDLNKNFRKILLLSAGSYFENQITHILKKFVKVKSNNDLRIINFLEKQAINGKYFQLFEWGKQDKVEEFGSNANKFFSFFGNEFKKEIETELKLANTDTKQQIIEKEKLNTSITAFIEIGHLRNYLVHSNLAALNYDQKTTQEIYDLFLKAETFLIFLEEKLN